MEKWGLAGSMTGSSAGHDLYVASRIIGTILELFSQNFLTDNGKKEKHTYNDGYRKLLTRLAYWL